MKTLKSISKIALMAFAILISSCSSDDGGGGGTTASGTIKAKIGGANFTSMQAATVAMKVAVGNTYTITVQGSDASGKAISLIMNGITLQTGTFDIGGDNVIAVVGSYTEINVNTMTSKSFVAPFEGGAVAGSVTISEITDTKIVGTFEFTGKNQEDQSDVKEITNGAFNVNFTSF